MRYILCGLLVLLAACPLLAAEPIQLETPTGTIYGTLELPASKTKARVPVALIIAGSGPTDRDGNSVGLPGKNDSLKLLAEGLKQHGIASVRYDKRGVGESTLAAPPEADMRFDDFVNDAVVWLRELRNDRRFSTITIIGHSEGALIGTVAARREKADAFVSIACTGFPAAIVLTRQLADKLPPDLLKESSEVIEKLSRCKTTTEISPALRVLFRPSVQPYLISWFRYDPPWEISHLKIPIFIVQGTTDIQVNVDDTRRLHQANPRALLLIVHNMNHVLKLVPDDMEKQVASYSDPALPLAPQLVDNISGFIYRLP